MSSTLRQLLLAKRDAQEAEAERWADSFVGECRVLCRHTAAEHSENRAFVAAVLKDLLAEVRAARKAGFVEES